MKGEKTPMKVYEIGFKDDNNLMDCTVWIATDGELILPEGSEALYSREIEISDTCSGIDIIIK